MPAIKEISVGRSDIFMVPPHHLRVKPGWNAREGADPENVAHIESLAMSIAAVGVLEPLTVFREGEIFFVSDGHCRLAAVQLAIKNGAEIKAIPVKTEGRASDEADRAFSQIGRNAGKPLSALEAGRVYKRLIGYGWTVEQIAERSGKPRSTVDAALDLQGAPAEVKALVASGKVSPSLATRVAKQQGEGATKTLTDAVDRATQKGKGRATAVDIGQEPTLPKKRALSRLKELFDDAEIDDTAMIGVTVRFSDKAFDEIRGMLKL